MNMQLRTILLGLLSIGFVQGYAQTFALQVKNEGITYLNDERETGYLISPIAATMLLGRIFLLLVMQCLYPGRRVIILRESSVPLTM